MKPEILTLLKCPICGNHMEATPDGKSVHCRAPRAHCYDFAKSGYLNLNPPRGGEGDLKEAISARRAFLDAGYYAPLAQKIAESTAKSAVKFILDAGSGEGYYTAKLAETGAAVIGIDLSRAGIDAAAKRAKQTALSPAYAVGSIFSLPILDCSVDLVTNIFAPCCEEEFCRVLKDGGYLLVVAAGERHLLGLKEAIYDTPYLNPGRNDLPQSMTLCARENLTYVVDVKGIEMISALFSMTPYYWRTSDCDRQKLKDLESLSTTVDFDLFLYRKDPLV